MREFFSSKKFKVILAVIALMFGMMLYSASGDGVANIPRNLLEMVTTPFQKAGAFLSNTIGGWFADLAAAGETVLQPCPHPGLPGTSGQASRRVAAAVMAILADIADGIPQGGQRLRSTG